MPFYEAKEGPCCPNLLWVAQVLLGQLAGGRIPGHGKIPPVSGEQELRVDFVTSELPQMSEISEAFDQFTSLSRVSLWSGSAVKAQPQGRAERCQECFWGFPVPIFQINSGARHSLLRCCLQKSPSSVAGNLGTFNQAHTNA